MECTCTWWGEKRAEVPWHGMSLSLFFVNVYLEVFLLITKSLHLIQVNMIGINFEDNHVATGLGNHLARPILRDEWHENLTFEEGVKLLEKCMRVLLYRDRSAVNKIQVLHCFLFLFCSTLIICLTLLPPLPPSLFSIYQNI